MRQYFRKSTWQVVGSDANGPDGADGAGEQSAAIARVYKVDEEAVEEFEEGEGGGDDHLEDIISGVLEQVTGRGWDVEDGFEEVGGSVPEGEEAVGIVRGIGGGEEDGEAEVEGGGAEVDPGDWKG